LTAARLTETPMNRFVLIAALALLPAAAGAQAIRCADPASGKTLYTDQPCKGGELVVPRRTEVELQQEAAQAAAARQRERERELDRAERALQRERQATREAVAARRAESLAESDTCRRARAEASFRAASFSASAEEIRTARYNAALACGQPPPSDIVVVQPAAPAWPVRRPWSPDQPHANRGSGTGFGMPAPPMPPRPRVDAPRESGLMGR